MRPICQYIHALIWTLIIFAGPSFGISFSSLKLQVRDGRPIVDGVYVNGHGPYRFLVDTGSNVNLIEAGLARKAAISATFRIDLASAAGKTPMEGSDGNEIALDSVKATGQRFLFSGLDAIHNSSPDVQGVLGEWFLSQFDYALDLRGKRLEFGRRGQDGARIPFRMINARPVISTNLGDLALDSGEGRLMLFGVQPDEVSGYLLHTVAGSQFAGKVFGRSLIVDGRRIWNGDAIALPNRPEPGVDGLLPLGLFKSVYVCNSEGYVVLE
jgi:hypothetical protein